MRKTIENFFRWLSDEAKGWHVLGYIVFAALIVSSLQYAVEAALVNWNIVAARPLPQDGETPYKYVNWFTFASMFLWAPMKEELMFRVLPLSFVIAFVSKTPSFVFGAATAFAALFGAIHPYSLAGCIQVAIAGFFFGLVFLKCGGLEGRFVKASLCAVAVHGLSNAFVVIDEWWRYFELTSK